MVYKLPTKVAMLDNFAHDINVTSRLNNYPLSRIPSRGQTNITFQLSFEVAFFTLLNIQKVRKHTVHIRFFAPVHRKASGFLCYLSFAAIKESSRRTPKHACSAVFCAPLSYLFPDVEN